MRPGLLDASHSRRPPISNPISSPKRAIELPELSPESTIDRDRARSSTSSIFSDTPSPPLLQPSPNLSLNNRPSSATNSSNYSFTPPTSNTSTPASSLRPSFASYDAERPDGREERSGIRNEGEGTEHNYKTDGRLMPIPQGEILSQPVISMDNSPTQDNLLLHNAESQTPTTTNTSPATTSLLTRARTSLSEKPYVQNAIGLAALIITFIATVYYGHRADRMNLSMSWAAWRQDCRDSPIKSEKCAEALKKATRPPPYEKLKRSVEWAVERVAIEIRAWGAPGSPVIQEPKSANHPTLVAQIIPYFGLFSLIPFCLWGIGYFRYRRNPREYNRPIYGPDLVRKAPSFTIIKEHSTGHHIGLTHRHGKKPSHTLPFHPNETSNDHKKSWQDHFDDLHSNPEWKTHIEDLATDVKSTNGGLPGKRISSTNNEEEESDSDSTISKFKRHVREKIHRVSSAESSLAALGASLEPYEISGSEDEYGILTKYRRFRIKKGVTSVGLVHIGTCLGASVGGGIGQEMLIKGDNGPGDLMNAKGDLMVPSEPQDVSVTMMGISAGGGANLFARVA